MAGTVAHRAGTSPAAHPTHPPLRPPHRRRGARGVVRVAIVTESFLPSLNGVTTSVCRVAGVPARRAATRPSSSPRALPRELRRVCRARPGLVPVRQFPVGLPMPAGRGGAAPPSRRTSCTWRHRSSSARVRWPPPRGWDLPTVAVYQTDMPSYLRQHGPGAVGRGAARAAWRWVRRIHGMADLTLAPSTAALAELREHAVPRTALWARGVDAALFHPGRRDDAGSRALRRSLAPDGRAPRRVRRAARPREGAATAWPGSPADRPGLVLWSARARPT